MENNINISSLIIYALYEVSGCDGRGDVKYKGKTASKDVAREFLVNARKSQYCFSYVLKLGENAGKKIFYENEL